MEFQFIHGILYRPKIWCCFRRNLHRDKYLPATGRCHLVKNPDQIGGVNIGQFVSQFNEKTRDMMGITIPVVITVYNDRTFEFILKSPPAAVLLKKAAGVAKGSGNPLKNKVGSVSAAQVEQIAKQEYEDLNASCLGEACKMFAGTARSMGIDSDWLMPAVAVGFWQ